jgi:hypothetical protein
MTMPMTTTPTTPPGISDLFRSVARAAQDAGVFGDVSVAADRVVCAAAAPAAPAEYRLSVENGRVWVGFYTADRWLSHSIEADLLHTGDKLGQLIGEELVELGLEGPLARVGEPEHFRDDAKQFTFRSPVPVGAGEWSSPKAADLAAKYLFAYEAALRDLGDVDTRED